MADIGKRALAYGAMAEACGASAGRLRRGAAAVVRCGGIAGVEGVQGTQSRLAASKGWARVPRWVRGFFGVPAGECGETIGKPIDHSYGAC